MKIAVPTQDKESIFRRTGRAPLFQIFVLENGVWKEAGAVPNRHREEDDHDETKEHSHADLINQIKDCDTILLNKVGKHLKHDLDNAGIRIIKTDITDIKKALEKVGRS